MNIIFKIVNLNNGESLQKRLFNLILEERKPQLILYKEIRWLKKQISSKILCNLIKKIKSFLKKRQISTKWWIDKYSFFVQKQAGFNDEWSWRQRFFAFCKYSRPFESYLDCALEIRKYMAEIMDAVVKQLEEKSNDFKKIEDCWIYFLSIQA